jgi:hypothetical protein
MRVLRQHQAVAERRHRAQDGMARVVERAPDLAHALDDAVVGHGEAVPDRLDELPLAHQPVRVGDEMAQHREGLGPERDDRPVPGGEGLGREVDRHAVDDERRGRDCVGIRHGNEAFASAAAGTPIRRRWYGFRGVRATSASLRPERAPRAGGCPGDPRGLRAAPPCSPSRSRPIVRANLQAPGAPWPFRNPPITPTTSPTAGTSGRRRPRWRRCWRWWGRGGSMR